MTNEERLDMALKSAKHYLEMSQSQIDSPELKDLGAAIHWTIRAIEALQAAHDNRIGGLSYAVSNVEHDLGRPCE